MDIDRTVTVGLIVGSVSEPSLNRRFAGALAKLAPRAGLELREIPIGELPFYGTQYDRGFPPVAQEYRAALDEVPGLLMVTPEYNRSIPGVLKNAIDWATRPSGESWFPGKPVGVIGTSKGAISTAVAQNHLKAVLTAVGAAVLGRPEAYVRYTEGLVDDDGDVTDASTERFLVRYLEALRAHVVRVGG